MTKLCKLCNQSKPLTEFYKSLSMKDGYRNQCKNCIISLSKERHKRLYTSNMMFRKQKIQRSEKDRLKRQYGITLEQRQELLEKQHFRCAICNIHQHDLKQILDVDHCHKTNIIRGMLCWRCNRAEGLLLSNPDLAIKLANYLLIHNKKDHSDEFI